MEGVDGAEADVHVASFDCEKYKNICNAFQIKANPTFIYFYKKQYYIYDFDINNNVINEISIKKETKKMQSFIENEWTNLLDDEERSQFTPDLENLSSNTSIVKELTYINYNSYMKSDKKVIIKFVAPWCGHCKRYSSIFESIAKENKDYIFLEVDCDEERVICRAFNIKSYPTLKLVENGYYLDIPTREKHGLLSFVKQSHENETKKEIIQLKVFNMIVHEIKLISNLLWNDFNEIKGDKKGIIGVFFAYGSIFGIILTISAIRMNSYFKMQKKHNT